MINFADQRLSHFDSAQSDNHLGTSSLEDQTRSFLLPNTTFEKPCQAERSRSRQGA